MRRLLASVVALPLPAFTLVVPENRAIDVDCPITPLLELRLKPPETLMGAFSVMPVLLEMLALLRLSVPLSEPTVTAPVPVTVSAPEMLELEFSA